MRFCTRANHWKSIGKSTFCEGTWMHSKYIIKPIEIERFWMHFRENGCKTPRKALVKLLFRDAILHSRKSLKKHWEINVLRKRENASKIPYKTCGKSTNFSTFSRKWPQNTKKSIGKNAISRRDSAPAQIIQKALGNHCFAKAQEFFQNTL